MNLFEAIFKDMLFYERLFISLFGIAIVINPTAVFNFVGYLITAYFVLLGLINLFEAYKTSKNGCLGIWTFQCNCFSDFRTDRVLICISNRFDLTNFLGLMILANGAFQLFISLNTKSKGWSLYSLILLIGGLILLFNPFQSLMVLFQIFGGILIFMGISEIINYFKVRNMYVN